MTRTPLRALVVTMVTSVIDWWIEREWLARRYWCVKVDCNRDRKRGYPWPGCPGDQSQPSDNRHFNACELCDPWVEVKDRGKQVFWNRIHCRWQMIKKKWTMLMMKWWCWWWNDGYDWFWRSVIFFGLFFKFKIFRRETVLIMASGDWSHTTDCFIFLWEIFSSQETWHKLY